MPVAAQQASHHFKVADGFEVKLWAAEPMLENPTNIDIDERGRVLRKRDKAR
jgi:hypothetical protein